MNYIKRLETEREALTAQLAAAFELVQDFRAHLQGDKFKGADADGDRKDWIATGDVDSRLREIAGNLIVEG